MFKVFPAIDILDGKAVRLEKGQFDKQTVYNESPILQAESFFEQGSSFLHVIDLDGAKDPSTRQLNLLRKIGESLPNATIQVGGGVRTEDDIQGLFAAGVQRVILGSVAVKDPEFVQAMIRKFGRDKIIVALDVMPDKEIYKIAVAGWQEDSGFNLLDFVAKFKEESPILLVTDISRDGMLVGPNWELYNLLAEICPGRFIVSGGVKELNDVQKAKDIGAEGIILGKALYTGLVDLKGALSVS